MTYRNSWNTPIPSRAAREQAERVNLGFQCPECFGVRVEMQPRQPHDPYRYQCTECGCQWSRSCQR